MCAACCCANKYEPESLDRVPGGSRFGWENPILVVGHHHFRVQQESFVSELDPRDRVKAEFAVRECVVRQFGVDIIKSEIEPDRRMQRGSNRASVPGNELCPMYSATVRPSSTSPVGARKTKSLMWY